MSYVSLIVEFLNNFVSYGVQEFIILVLASTLYCYHKQISKYVFRPVFLLFVLIVISYFLLCIGIKSKIEDQLQEEKRIAEEKVRLEEEKKKSLPSVKELFEQAKNGNTDAMSKIGIMYYRGDIFRVNYEQAFYWAEKAAEHGHVVAQYNVAYMHYVGKYVTKDYVKAFYWYLKAAEQGYASAQNQVGYMYHWGLGVNVDYEQAISWYTKAAEQGNLVAQYNMGCLYEERGSVVLLRKAYMYYYLAFLGGDVNAGTAVHRIEKMSKLSSSQVKDARFEALRKFNKIKK